MSSPSLETFRYEAARPDGVKVRGVVEAASRPAAAAVLSARGLFPLAVEARRVQSTPGWIGRPSVRAQATLFQGLASLVEAGVPLEKALVVAQTVAAGRLQEATARVAERVRQGASLAASLDAERLFSPITVGLVRAGERGLGLGAGLTQAAAQLEREAETSARIRSALAYPALLAVVGTLSVGLIVLFVVPRFAALLGDLGQALPTATRLLLAGSEVIQTYGVGLAALLVIAGVVAARQVTQRRKAWHCWLLEVPILGPIRYGLASARASRTLAALLGTGTPALEALRVASLAVGDEAIAERLMQASDRVAEGASLSAALDGCRALTSSAIQLAKLGEGSGRLPGLLAKAADLEDQSAERRLKVLVALLEPALIIGFATLVAFVAAALLQAVYAVRPG